MTTSSANIAGVIKPIGMVRRPSGFVFVTSDGSSSKKKKRKKPGIYEVISVDNVTIIGEMKEKRYIVKGKKGVWRTIRGKHYFFPDDKSGVIPPINGSKK